MRRTMQTIAIPVFQFGTLLRERPELLRRPELLVRRAGAHQPAPVSEAGRRQHAHAAGSRHGGRRGHPHPPVQRRDGDAPRQCADGAGAGMPGRTDGGQRQLLRALLDTQGQPGRQPGVGREQADLDQRLDRHLRTAGSATAAPARAVSTCRSSAMARRPSISSAVRPSARWRPARSAGSASTTWRRCESCCRIRLPI